MRALIIEDNDYKLNNAIRILGEFGITDYVHFDNLFQASNVFFDGEIDGIDLIILDLIFFETPSHEEIRHKYAGATFLYFMADYGVKNPVIVYSSEKNYLDNLNKYLFPSLQEYRELDTSPSFSNIETRHKEYLERNRELFEYIDFVRGHAHTESELESLIRAFVEDRNSK